MTNEVIPESLNSLFPVYPMSWPELPISPTHSLFDLDFFLRLDQTSSPPLVQQQQPQPISMPLWAWSDTITTNSAPNAGQRLEFHIDGGNPDSLVGSLPKHSRNYFERLIKMFEGLPKFSIKKIIILPECTEPHFSSTDPYFSSLSFLLYYYLFPFFKVVSRPRVLLLLECQREMLNLKRPSMLPLAAIRLYLFEGMTAGFRFFIEMTVQNFRICAVNDAEYWSNSSTCTTSRQQPFILDLHINEHLRYTVLSLMHKLSIHWVSGANQRLPNSDLCRRLPDWALHGPYVQFICYQGPMLNIGLRYHVNRVDAKAFQILDDPSVYRATSIVLTGRNTIWGISIQALWVMLDELSNPDKLSVKHPKVEEFLEMLDINYMADDENPQADCAPKPPNVVDFPSKTDPKETQKQKFRKSEIPVECSETSPLFDAQESQNGVEKQDWRKKQKGKCGISKFTIDLDGLKPYFSLTLINAAKKLNVSRSTLKRTCRQLRIPRWPRNNLNHLNESAKGAGGAFINVPHAESLSLYHEPSKLQENISPTSKTLSDGHTEEGDQMLLQEAENISPTSKISSDGQAKVGDQILRVIENISLTSNTSSNGQDEVGNQMVEFVPNFDEGSSRYKTESTFGKKRKTFIDCSCKGLDSVQDMGTHAREISHVTAARPDARMVTMKATYGEDMIRFQLSSASGIVELKAEVTKRLKLEPDSFKIKYLDDGHDWILIGCEEDLQNCMSSLGTDTIKLQVHNIIPISESSCKCKRKVKKKRV